MECNDIECRVEPEVLLTVKEAAARLGHLSSKVRYVVRAELPKSYCILNARRLVRLSEAVGATQHSSEGGSDAPLTE